MAADEIWLDSKCFHLPVDICLNASYIGKNAAIVQISFDLLQVSRVIGNRRAQEYVAAMVEVIVNGSGGYVYNGFLSR